MKKTKRSVKSVFALRLFAVCMLMCGLLSVSLANADVIALGDWRLDGDTLDNGYNGNNGTFVGTAAYSTGIYGQAASFNGSNYIKIDNYTAFNNMTAFTLSAWVYPTSNSSYSSIISKVNPNRDFDLQLSNGKINVHFAHGGTYYSCTSDNQVPLNQWSYISAVWTGTKWQIFFNGTLVKEADYTGKAPLWTGTKLGIGTMDFSYNFNGKIDEAKIFDMALTPDNILEMYEAGLRTTNITITCDNVYNLYVNGNYLGSGSNWQAATKYNLSLVPGKNVIAVQGIDQGSYAGLLADIQCEGVHIGTDFNWKVATANYSYWNTTSFDDTSWAYANDFGRYGVYPWNKSVSGMPSNTDAHWIWQGASNVNAATPVYFRLEINVSDDPVSGRLIEIMDPRPTTGAFAGVDYKVKSNVRDMPLPIKSRLTTRLKSSAVDETEEPESGTLTIPASEFSALKSTSAAAVPAVNDVYLATDIERALRIRSTTYDSATASYNIAYEQADVADVFEYYDIPMQAVELNESNYIPASNLKSTDSSGSYTKSGSDHVYSFNKVLIDVNQNGFIAHVEMSGKLTLTSPKFTGQYKRNKYDFKFTAGEKVEVKLTGNVQLKKEVKIPLYGFNIDAGLGKVTIGIFIVIGIDGKVTFEYGILQSISVEAGIKGKSFLYIPRSFHPYWGLNKTFTVTKKVEGSITISAGLQPEVGLDILGKKIIGLYIFGGIEGTGTFNTSTYTLKIDALLKSVLTLLKKQIKLFEVRWNLVNESGNFGTTSTPVVTPAPTPTPTVNSCVGTYMEGLSDGYKDGRLGQPYVNFKYTNTCPDYSTGYWEGFYAAVGVPH